MLRTVNIGSKPTRVRSLTQRSKSKLQPNSGSTALRSRSFCRKETLAPVEAVKTSWAQNGTRLRNRQNLKPATGNCTGTLVGPWICDFRWNFHGRFLQNTTHSHKCDLIRPRYGTSAPWECRAASPTDGRPLGIPG